MKRGTATLPLVLVLLAFAACGGGSSSPTQPADLSTSQVESQSFSLVNDARSAEHVSPMLTFDQLLAEVARDHSAAMRDLGFFAHVDPNGQSLRDRLRAAGVTFRSAGENLAQVDGSVDPAGHAHRLLMESKSHRDNILSSSFQAVGVGVAKEGDSYWITQVFIER